MKKHLTILAMLYFCFTSSSLATDSPIDPAAVLDEIARDIAALKSEFPQLKDFVVPQSYEEDNYEISYRFNALDPQGDGGWSGGTPSPKDDGVWFYISVHSPLSTRQIHTQPITLGTYLGSYRFQFLLKEGKHTKSVQSAVWKIFREHGVVDGKQ